MTPMRLLMCRILGHQNRIHELTDSFSYDADDVVIVKQCERCHRTVLIGDLGQHW